MIQSRLSLEDGDIRETIRPYIMGRIVDVEQFFQKYHCDSSADNICISFEVEDNFLSWNNKTFSVRFPPGSDAPPTKAQTRHQVKLSIATLTTMLLGYKTAAKLHRMGQNESR